MSRTTGRCVGAAVAELPVDLEQHGRNEAESRRPLVAAEARNAHFGEAGDAIAYLDALAAQIGIRPTPLDDALHETIADLRSRP